MNLNFTTFVSTKKIPENEIIGVKRTGIFYFYSSLYLKKGLNHFKFVQISYDKENRAVAFNFTNDGSLAGVLKVTKRGNSGAIKSTPFWRDIGLDPKDCVGDYIPQTLSIGGQELIYIILKERNGITS